MCLDAQPAFVFIVEKGGLSMKREVKFRIRSNEGRNSGIDSQSGCIESSWSCRKATRGVCQSLDRKQRFDMNKNGLEIRPSRRHDTEAQTGPPRRPR